MDIEQMKSSSQKKSDGVWVPIGHGAEVKVACRRNNAKVDEYIRKAYRHKRYAIARGNLSAQETRDLMVPVLAKIIVLDWRNIELGGEPLPFSEENAARILRDYEEFYDLILEISDDVGLFRDEEAEGNSSVS